MKPTKRILLVEDDLYISDVYATVLKQAGYSVEMAANGNEALALIKANRPDLILLDIMLPGIDGFQILELLRKDQEFKQVANTPVVITTNLARDEVASKAKQYKVKDYVIKADIIPSQLVELVKALDKPRA